MDDHRPLSVQIAFQPDFSVAEAGEDEIKLLTATLPDILKDMLALLTQDEE